MSNDQIIEKLKEKSLKVTPQRISILEAVYNLRNHPTADNIIDYIKRTHPNIATGTVYNVLDTLVESNLVRRVKTDKDAMRYDGMLESHHHLYCSESDRIEDYYDEELDEVIKGYFRKKGIPDFEITEIKLQINGNFSETK